VQTPDPKPQSTLGPGSLEVARMYVFKALTVRAWTDEVKHKKSSREGGARAGCQRWGGRAMYSSETLNVEQVSAGPRTPF